VEIKRRQSLERLVIERDERIAHLISEVAAFADQINRLRVAHCNLLGALHNA
jgi:hypothetical protein